MEENEVKEAVPETIEDLPKEELNLHEQLTKANEEFKEKYHDLIYDLATKYNMDVGVGCDMAKAIARAVIFNEEPLYVANVEYNLNELVEDYRKIYNLSVEIAKGEGRI